MGNKPSAGQKGPNRPLFSSEVGWLNRDLITVPRAENRAEGLVSLWCPNRVREAVNSPRGSRLNQASIFLKSLTKDGQQVLAIVRH